MAQVIVRNIEEDLKEQLQAPTQAHGWNLEEEVRRAVGVSAPIRPRLGSRIAQRFAEMGLDEPLTELRCRTHLPMDLKP